MVHDPLSATVAPSARLTINCQATGSILDPSSRLRGYVPSPSVAGAGWGIANSQASQRVALMTRFDTRQATAARFIEAYVGEVFTREQVIASRVFTGPTTGAQFAKAAADQGYDAAVLVDANGRLLATQPENPAAIGRNVLTFPHMQVAVGGVPAVSGVVLSAQRGLPVVGFSVPFDTPTGRRVFSGGYAVKSTPLAPFVRNALPFRTGGAEALAGVGGCARAGRSHVTVRIGRTTGGASRHGLGGGLRPDRYCVPGFDPAAAGPAADSRRHRRGQRGALSGALDRRLVRQPPR